MCVLTDASAKCQPRCIMSTKQAAQSACTGGDVAGSGICIQREKGMRQRRCTMHPAALFYAAAPGATPPCLPACLCACP